MSYIKIKLINMTCILLYSLVMPIHTSWKKMIKAIGEEYKEGEKKCRKLSDGSQVCISEKAWSVFYGKVNKEYGKGAEEKPMSKNVGESEVNEGLSDLGKDILIKWYLEEMEKEEDE